MASPDLRLTTSIGDILEVPKDFRSYRVLDVVDIGPYTVTLEIVNAESNTKFLGRVMRVPTGDAAEITAFKREITQCELLECDYLLKTIEAIYLEYIVIVVIERSYATDLMSMIEENPSMIVVNWKKMTRQICLGIQHLHERGLSHQNLRPENVLVDDNFDIELCNYGLLCEARKQWIATGKCDDLAYLSPEVTRNDNYNGRTADIWALGVLLHLMVTGVAPWDGDDMVALHEEITRGIPTISSISGGAREIIVKCCEVNAAARWNIDQVLENVANQKSPRPFPAISSLPASNVGMMRAERRIRWGAPGNDLFRREPIPKAPSGVMFKASGTMLLPKAQFPPKKRLLRPLMRPSQPPK